MNITKSSNKAPDKFNISGTWAKDPTNMGRPICLGIMICKQTKSLSLTGQKNRTALAGIAGGYCGSDLFVLEQFVCEIATNQIKPQVRSLWVGSQDILRQEEIDFNDLPTSILDTCHEALEECWEWNSENNYLESQQIRLYPYNLSGLTPSEKNDHLFYKPLSKDLKPLWKELHQGLHLTTKSLHIPTSKNLKIKDTHSLE
jgi:hypothetical protein